LRIKAFGARHQLQKRKIGRAYYSLLVVSNNREAERDVEICKDFLTSLQYRIPLDFERDAEGNLRAQKAFDRWENLEGEFGAKLLESPACVKCCWRETPRGSLMNADRIEFATNTCHRVPL
jgi:hypothetical protein